MPEPAVSKYDRDTQRFECLGLDLNRPVDSVRPGKFPILKNMRSFILGQAEPRFGLLTHGSVLTGDSPLHSVRRLNDVNLGLFQYIIGVGTHLAYGTVNPFVQALYFGGTLTFSSDPLALVPYVPTESPQTWMFIGDRSPNVTGAPANALTTALKKINVTGLVHQVGLPAPTVPPTITIGTPLFSFNDPNADFDFEYANSAALQAAWINGGTAGLPTLLTRINTTITAILYDSGTTGWACINPASSAGVGKGAIIVFNSGGGTAERAVAHSVHAVSTSTTIASVIYDSGTSGNCSIVLTNPLDEVDVNSMLSNSTRSEFNRVISVTRGPDGNISVRCSTVATYVAGDTIATVASFRVFLANNHIATETLTAHAAETAITTGLGYLTRTLSFDLSKISASAASRPDDYIHVAVRTDLPANLNEIKLMFDIDAATNDFAHNYYYAAIRPSDLTPSVTNAQTLLITRQNIITKNLIDQSLQDQSGFDTLQGTNQATQDISNVNPPDTSGVSSATSSQTDPGASQYYEAWIKMSDFVRVGTDFTRTWANVAAIRVQVSCNGNVTFDVDDIFLSGGYGPDQSPTGIPYLYRYRARVKSTGAKSNPSPPTRGGSTPYREQLVFKAPQYVLAPECDVLDVERFGGDIPEWHYVSTISNSASPTFTDIYPDDVIAGNPREDTSNTYGLDSFQLWPVIGLPVTGTTGQVSGTTVNDSGTNFNLQWSLGTNIKINGIPCTLYRVISTSRLEIFENVNSLNAVTWEIEAPIITSQPFPCLWGPLDSVLFGCGDPINPGRLYWTNASGESTGQNNWKDVTNSSEPLMNGVIYNNRAYVWSNARFFMIIRTPEGNFDTKEIPDGKGLFSRWAITRIPGPVIYYLATDGIYKTNGGTPESITKDWLYPLFPTESLTGKDFPPIYGVNIAYNTRNQLNFATTFLYFDYVDTQNNQNTLVYDPDKDAWFYDTYLDGVGVGIHYGVETAAATTHQILLGGNNAPTSKLYEYNGFSDDGIAIACQIRTPSRDQGDPRANKYYGDVMLDCNTAGVNVTVTPGVNNYGTTYPATTVNNASRTQVPININQSTWITARNIALDISFSVSTSARPVFYIWEPRWIFEPAPISAFSWEIPSTTFGLENFKSLGFGRICHVSTADLTLLITLDGVNQPILTIPNSGGIYKESVFRFPVYKGKIYRVRVSSASEFRLDGRDSYVELKEWADANEYRKLRVFGDFSYIEG